MYDLDCLIHVRFVLLIRKIAQRMNKRSRCRLSREIYVHDVAVQLRRIINLRRLWCFYDAGEILEWMSIQYVQALQSALKPLKFKEMKKNFFTSMHSKRIWNYSCHLQAIRFANDFSVWAVLFIHKIHSSHFCTLNAFSFNPSKLE